VKRLEKDELEYWAMGSVIEVDWPDGGGEDCSGGDWADGSGGDRSGSGRHWIEFDWI